MENFQNAGTSDPNEKLEDEVLKPIVDDEIKTKIVEKYGISEDDNPELIAKLVEEEKENHKKLSTAISQKRRWREEAQKVAQKPAQKPAETPQTVPAATPMADIDKLVEEKLNERELKTMPLSDELKGEVKAYAKAKGILYSEAVSSPYISYLKEKEEEKKRSEEASISSKGGGMKAKKDFATMSDEQIKEMSTEEFAEYQSWIKKQ